MTNSRRCHESLTEIHPDTTFRTETDLKIIFLEKHSQSMIQTETHLPKFTWIQSPRIPLSSSNSAHRNTPRYTFLRRNTKINAFTKNNIFFKGKLLNETSSYKLFDTKARMKKKISHKTIQNLTQNNARKSNIWYEN